MSSIICGIVGAMRQNNIEFSGGKVEWENVLFLDRKIYISVKKENYLCVRTVMRRLTKSSFRILISQAETNAKFLLQ